MERDNYRYVEKCHQCQINRDFIRVMPNELNIMGSPWLFASWGMDLIGPIEPAASNGNVVDNHMQWHKKLSFALLGYRTTMKTSTGKTPYMLVHGTEAVIPTRFKIPSLIIIQEAKLDNTERIRVRQQQLMLIDEKRMDVVCHGQLYQNRMANAFNTKVKPQ
ncbi:uncharacterized protein LOC142167187 [Nicotiana tabacum]|uniref:Uncharacterized protein LOC142167187 n=1 Tax=Nicotiana tabacum TaxID=4097 RepID=A0AC58SEP0_TOBAC